jgi:hypothetical protein
MFIIFIILVRITTIKVYWGDRVRRQKLVCHNLDKLNSGQDDGCSEVAIS